MILVILVTFGKIGLSFMFTIFQKTKQLLRMYRPLSTKKLGFFAHPCPTLIIIEVPSAVRAPTNCLEHSWRPKAVGPGAGHAQFKIIFNLLYLPKFVKPEMKFSILLK